MTQGKEHLHSDGKLVRNFLWNVLGTIVPQLVALFAIPLLVNGLGSARFGVLTIAWMVVGYFSLFDLGLGRAMTKLVSEKLGAKSEHEIPHVVWTAMTLMGLLGLVGAVAIALMAPWLTGGALKIPSDLQLESLHSFYLLAVSVPIVIGTIGLRGILEAHQRFDVVNYVRLPLGVMTFAGPLLVLPFTNSLVYVVMVLVVARIFGWLAYLVANLSLFPELRQAVRVDRASMKRLLAFGGWMTVSNLAAPLLLYLGRLFIIAMISAEAVAYFVTPYEVVINLLVIPSMLISVLFPAFSHLFQSGREVARRLYGKGFLAVFLIMLPLAIAVYIFARPGLAWWINEEFAVNGFRVAQILAIGVFINSFGHLAQALIQSYGRPDLTAKLHVVELLIYVPYLWYLIAGFGIDGAAVAWSIRVTISTIVLTVMARKCLAGTIAARY